MKKKNIFVDKNHDYVYVKKKKKDDTIIHELYYSHSNAWNDSIKGNLILGVTDTGDGYEFYNKNKKSLEYDEGFELAILMRLITKKEGLVEITSSIKEI